MKKIGPVTLDFETAGGITLVTLKEQRSYLKKELAAYKKGQYLHPEDVVGNQKLIEAMDLIIKYYGG